MFITLFWAHCFASEGKSVSTTQFVEPWNIPQLEVDDDCIKLCDDWSTLYFSSEYDSCVGEDGVSLSKKAGNISFCPNKETVVAWTRDEEYEFQAFFQQKEKLEKSELKIFYQRMHERKMKLSVHQWQMLPPAEINVIPEDRRRVQGSYSSYRCFGGNGGSWRWFERRKRPYKVTVRAGAVIDRLEFYYRGSILSGGGYGGRAHSHSLPSCTTIVFIKSGSLVDAIQFLSQGYETRYYGGSGGGSYVVVAPRGRCLGDIKIRTGGLVDRICVKFNA